MNEKKKQDVLDAIKTIKDVISGQELPAGIKVTRSENISLLNNTLIKCGISIEDSKAVTAYANTINDEKKDEIRTKLSELIESIKTADKTEAQQIGNWFKNNAGSISSIISSLISSL